MIIGWEQELVKRTCERFARGNNAPPVEDVQNVIAGRARAVRSNDESAGGRILMRSSQIRRIFFRELFRLVRVVWPILSWVLFAMVGPGLLIGHIEGWRIVDALYFTFVTGLTIGYGDLTPRHVVSRLLAVVIGFAGIVLTGLVVALCVAALRVTARLYRSETGHPASSGSTTCTTRQGPKDEYPRE